MYIEWNEFFFGLPWHWKPWIPKPQMKSLQWLQKVGCLKKRWMNLCSLTTVTAFWRTAPRLLNCLAFVWKPSWPLSRRWDNPLLGSSLSFAEPALCIMSAKCGTWTLELCYRTNAKSNSKNGTDGIFFHYFNSTKRFCFIWNKEIFLLFLRFSLIMIYIHI